MISIKAKLEAIHKGLSAVEEETKYLDLNILRKLGGGITSKAKQTYKTMLKQRTGNFYRSIHPTLNRPRRKVVITASADNNGVRYPWILAAGKRLDPRSGKTLTFGPFDWVERPGNQYMASEKADDDIEKVIESLFRQLKRKGVIA